MENFDEAERLHFVRKWLFQPRWPLHQKFSVSLQQLITTRLTHRGTRSFLSMFNDLIQAATADVRDKCDDLEAKLEVHRQKMHDVQVATENATGGR